MTTWYTSPGGYRAWSVRPDLWPPGTFAWVRYAPSANMLATWSRTGSSRSLDERWVVPGAAEALVLGGQVQESDGGYSRTLLTWTEVDQ